MKIQAGLFLTFIVSYLIMPIAHAQVDPGNDPVMWSYVDPTQFWIILVVMAVVGGGFTIYFRRKPAPKNNA